ncbi:MAG: Asp-tRNA(Asn)/Glu-tRNA(Gln) amidotransferase subunit GatC [Dehalococcoidia bacterium]|tara:strand:+ start:1836 stop:2147 length:312 start_codon:yes stop_codon:yes gene_type:complete
MDTNDQQLNIENLAELAKINLSGEELKKYKDQINNIIDHFSSLRKIDTENFNSNYWEIDNNKIAEVNDLRKDEVIESFNKNETFQNAPENENGFIKIRKILDR